MKQEKLEAMIKGVKVRIEWEQENIDRCMKEIKEKAQCDDPINVAMFMPGKVRELQKAIDRKDKYSEQLDMLKYLMRNEEE